MDNGRSTTTDLTFAISQAVDAVVKEHPGVHVMEVCAALGAAAGALVSASIPEGNEGTDRIALRFLAQGFEEFLLELRKSQAN